MTTFTKEEAAILRGLLESYQDDLNNADCNDHEIQKKHLTLGFCANYNAYLATDNVEDMHVTPKNGYTLDFMLVGYFMEKLK